MSRKIEVQIVGDSSSLHRALGSATSGTSRLGSAFGHVARIAAGLGGLLAGVEILKFGKESVSAAAQTQKATESIRENFGKAGKEVIDFNERAASSFGIAIGPASQFATQIGLMTTNIGLSKKAGADMTIGLEKLAGAVGLIKGQDPAEAFGKLNKALLGNTRGLKDMGIAITPVAEKLQAVRDGFIGPKGTVSALTAAQKAQVIYGLAVKHLPTLLDQARQHSGDFADQMLILRARLSNLSEEIGAKALPVVQELVGSISKIAAAPSFTVGVEVAFRGIEAGAKSIAEGIRHAIEGSTQSFEIKAPSGKLLGHGSTFTKGIVQNIADGLRGADWSKIGTQVGAAIGGAIKISSTTASRIVNSLADGLAANSGKIANVMAKIGILMAAAIFQDVLDPSFWISNWRVAAGVAISAVLLAFGPESKLALALKDLPIAGYFFKALEKFVGAPLLNILRRLGRGIAAGLRSVFPEATKGGEEIAARVAGGLRSLPERGLRIVERMGEKIGQALGLTARDAARGAARIGSRIVDGLDNFVAAVGRVANRLATRIIAPLESLAGRAIRPVAAMGRTIGRVLGGFISNVFSVGARLGRSIMEGIASGLDSLIGWLEGKISSIASGLLDKAKGILHIGSPSKRFAEEIGKPIMQGIALGITKHAPLAHTALANSITPSSMALPGRTAGRSEVIQLVLDGKVLASWLREHDKQYRRQNGGRPLLSGS